MFPGPQISFSGAVWTNRPHFQVLTPTLPLFCHLTDTAMHESLARHFGAFKAAIRSLEQCYDALKNPALLENLDPQFPDPRRYRSLETKITVNFKYLHQIDEKKLLFIGENDNGERICIKFVRRYSQAVHEKCAQMGIAPKLRGFENIGAGWKMVLMDALDEEYQPFNKRTLPVGAENTSEIDWSNSIKPTLCTAMYEMSTSWLGRMASRGLCSSTLTGQGSSARRAILLMSTKWISGGQTMCRMVS
jgi:hypothetical protein